MLYSIIYALSLILILCGLFFLFYVFIQKCLCIGAKREFCTVIAGYEEKENLPDEIYCALTQMNLFNFANPTPVIVVDYNLSDETKRRCVNQSEPFGGLIFCSEQELSEIIRNNLYRND